MLPYPGRYTAGVVLVSSRVGARVTVPRYTAGVVFVSSRDGVRVAVPTCRLSSGVKHFIPSKPHGGSSLGGMPAIHRMLLPLSIINSCWHRPATRGQIPQTSDQRSDPTDQRPEVRSHRPAARGQIRPDRPATRGQTPQTSDQRSDADHRHTEAPHGQRASVSRHTF